MNNHGPIGLNSCQHSFDNDEEGAASFHSLSMTPPALPNNLQSKVILF